MNLDNSAIVEYEIEREKWKLETNSDVAPTAPISNSRSGCVSFLVYLVVGIVIWRLVLEVFHYFIR